MSLMQLTEIVGFLKSVPDVIWSGVIASIITLSGVFLSNISNNNRLKQQLKHDADEKAKERTATLRREVYLQASEELVKANSHLARLPDIDVTKTNLADGLQGFFIAATRLQLVAEPRTALLMNQLSTDYEELLFKLSKDLIPLIKTKKDIEIADDFYKRTQTEINRILTEQRKFNESSSNNPSDFKLLQNSYEFESKQSEMYSDEKIEALKQFNNYNTIFQKRLLTELKEISSKQIPLMIEIRRDLGLTGDLTEIESHMRRKWLRMEEHLNNLIATLEKEF